MSVTDVPSGILVIDKPPGWTSHDVVNSVRRIFHTKKVGHAGTLDPMATGVLIVLVGKATKFSDQLLSQHKLYQASLQFGQQTDTGDAEGHIINTTNTSNLTEDLIKASLVAQIGLRPQMVPAYSAVKVNGQKLYNLARAGQPLLDRPSKDITIYSLKLDQFKQSPQGPIALITVNCSKGTYIRALAEEIAASLDSLAHLTSLRRLASGEFTIDQAISLSQLQSSHDPEQFLQNIDI